MKETELKDIQIKLNDMHDLFVPGEINPFLQDEMYITGIDQVYKELNASVLKKNFRLIISLPEDKIINGTEQEIRGAIKRYCDYRIKQNKYDIDSLNWERKKALQKGLLFLGMCVFTAFLINKQTLIPEFIRVILREGLFIIGWVSMWRPIEIILYEWWPYWREIKLNKKILSMEVIIKKI
ncbi:hypothetical protein ACFL4D_00545 [Candidatus Margulisiibacteriota bacterium]